MDNQSAVMKPDDERANDSQYIGKRHQEQLDAQYMQLVHDNAHLSAVAELQAQKLADLRGQLDAANARAAELEAAAKVPADAPVTVATVDAPAAVTADAAPAAVTAGPAVFSSNRLIESTPA